MAIDPRELDDVRPSASAIDRLKARKSRIKPWQTSAVTAQAQADASKETVDASPDVPKEIAASNDATPALNTPSADNELHVSQSAAETKSAIESEPNSPAQTSEISQPNEPEPGSNLVQTRFEPGSEMSQTNPEKEQIASKKPGSNLVQDVLLGAEEKVTPSKAPKINRASKVNQKQDIRPNAASDALVTSPESAAGTVYPKMDIFEIEAIRHDDEKNVVQTRFEPGSNVVQTGFKKEKNVVQTGFKPGSKNIPLDVKPSSEPGVNQVQSWFKPGPQPSSTFPLHKLSPLQQTILEFIFDQCVLERSEVTPPIRSLDLMKVCQSSQEGVRTAIKRMLKSGVLERGDYKDGRGGWTQYKLPKFVYEKLLIQGKGKKPGVNLVQTGFKPGSQPSSQPSSNSLIHSSIDSININKSIEPGYDPIAEYTMLNIEPVRKYGISIPQLQADAQKNQWCLSVDDIQDAIDRFAQYVSNPSNVRNLKGPIDFRRAFMGALKKKWETGTCVLDVFETPASQFLKELADQAETNRKNLESEKERLKTEHFALWWETLKKNPEERDRLVPPDTIATSGSWHQEKKAYLVFETNVWPGKEAEILGSLRSN